LMAAQPRDSAGGHRRLPTCIPQSSPRYPKSAGRTRLGPSFSMNDHRFPVLPTDGAFGIGHPLALEAGYRRGHGSTPGTEPSGRGPIGWPRGFEREVDTRPGPCNYRR
jgi:hypothetical protein